MTEAQFFYGGDNHSNGNEAYLPTPLRPRSASKSQRSKMLDHEEAPPTPSMATSAATNGVSTAISGSNTAHPAVEEASSSTILSTSTQASEEAKEPCVEENNAAPEKVDAAAQQDMTGSAVEEEAKRNDSETSDMLPHIIFPSSESTDHVDKNGNTDKTENDESTKAPRDSKGADDDEAVEELADHDAEKPRVDKGKGPEKPKVEIYSLPIGGGPKKNIVLPPIRTIPANKPRNVDATASSSRSRHTSSTSRSSKSSMGIPRSVKKGVSLQRIASAPKRSVSKLSVVTQGANGKSNTTRTGSAPDETGKEGVITNGPVKRKPKPRRPKNVSQQYVYSRRKDAGNGSAASRSATGQAQRRRVQRKPGQGKRIKKAQSSSAKDDTKEDEWNKATTSNTVVVGGQALELDDREDDADGEDEKDVEGEDDDISFMTAPDNDEALDDFDMEMAPTKYYEDDEVNDGDAPPLGSYATHPPSKARLIKASELSLYDEDGNIVQFGSIFETRRTLICFLRHWLCPFCQMFARSIQAIDPLPLERANMNLVVVGQGHWHVTKSYKEVMKIPSFVRMYADPSRKIYKMLGMTLRTNDQGPACTRPEYQTMGVFKASMVAMKKGIFDMPLRVPGDLMLLGGEFIMGPGPQCSFTHRMLTTRGHLDLPKVLTEAGCDMSLKSAPGILEEQSKRPGSTRSTDRRFSRKGISNRLSRRGRSSADLGQRKSDLAMTTVAPPVTTTSAFSEDDEDFQQPRKVSSTYTKRKPAPLSDIRTSRIGYPVKQKLSGLSPSYDEFEEDAMVPNTKDVIDRGDSDIDNALPSPRSPQQIIKPLGVVRESGIMSNNPKSSSMIDLSQSFTRPSRSTDRPPLPQTSSAEAFAAASARSKLIQRQEQEKILAALGKDGQKGGLLYSSSLATESMPALIDDKLSSPLMQVFSPSSLQRKHASNATGSTDGSGSLTADSAYTAKTTHSENGDLASPISIAPSMLASSSGRNEDNTIDTTVESDLQKIDATNPLTRSGSAKRRGMVGTAGVPVSVFEKLANAGSPKRAFFSSSSPSLPLGDAATFSDTSSTALKTPTTPKTEDGFGEDTEYRRLGREGNSTDTSKMERAGLASTPRVASNTVNGHYKAGLVPKPSKEHLNKPLPPLLVSSDEENSAATGAEDEDLLKTPRARKVSLGHEGASTMPFYHSNGSASQEIASSAMYTPNRGSIIAASPTTPSFEAPKVTPLRNESTGLTSSAFSNPLLAALPPMPAPTMPPPPPPSMPAVNAVSARAPMPATNPLFASILAEEAARKNNITASSSSTSGSNSRSEPTSALSEWRQFKQTPTNGAPKAAPAVATATKATSMTFGSSSFLDDLDVHDSLQTSKPSPNPAYSPNGAVSDSMASDFANDEEDEEEEDDWAPLQAGKNVIPAGIPEQEGEPSGDESQRTDTSASELSTGEEDYDEEDDEEDKAMTPAVQRYRGFMPAPAKTQKKYTLKQVTSRASNPATSSRPRKVDLKANPRRLYSSASRTGLSSFVEEDEEASSPPKKTSVDVPISI